MSDLTEVEIDKELKRQLEVLKYGVSEITPEDEFVKMLRHSISAGKPLRVKCGIDPTSTDVHLGHTVPYRKMRQFQELGHTGVVVIGDYTAQIGDPTGKVESRPALTPEETKENAKKYFEQVSTVLIKDKTEVVYQSSWFEKVTLLEIMKWASETTVAKLISHDTFKNRLESGHSLGLHEMFYPVLQGMDSVFIKADVELGGSDQKFNVLMGRDYQKARKQRPQVAILLPIITGTCGTQKMSKSLGNYIGILDEPFDKFGKLMSIPDELMPEYVKYATFFTIEEKNKLVEDLKNNSIHPNDAKKTIAANIVDFFHGAGKGQEMREQFERVFAKKKVPDSIEDYKFERGESIISCMVKADTVASNGEARRMIKQNAVSFVDAEKVTNPDLILDDSFTGKILKVGKRKFKKLI